MSERGKKYALAKQRVDRTRFYTPEEAMALVKETSYASFDGTVEVHMRMGLDPRQAEQRLRGVVVFPHGTGKKTRILVFAEGETQRIAREAAADYAGGDELIEQIQKGWTDFDVAFAVPQMMGKVGRLGRVLGPKGLMPNPRTGTVVPAEDIPRVVGEARKGRVEYRLDDSANIHVPIGKVSFPQEQLLENMATLMEAIIKAKPAQAKGQYIRSVTIASTMGPGIKVDVARATQLRAA